MRNLPRILLITGALVLAGCGERSAPPAPVLQLGTQPDSPAGAIIAERGDTLFSISKRYNLPMQDIILLNNIDAPYGLYTGQRLKLPAPRYYTVRPEDNLYRISRMFGVSVTDIARTNNLNAPYTLAAEQKLRMPSLEAERRVASRQRPASPSVQASRTQPSPPANQSVTSRPVGRQPAKAKPGPENFIWPVNGQVISNFGPKANGLHNDGLNIAASIGTSIRAAGGGDVVYVGDALESFGNLVILRHSNGWVTAYAHLNDVKVSRGQTLQRGDVLGTVGSTGRVDQPQLHFEIRRGAEALNPQRYLTKG